MSKIIDTLFHPDIARYKQWRKVGIEIATKMTKEIPRGILLEAAGDLGMPRKDLAIVFDSEEEINYVMDRAIQDIERNGKRFIEIYLESHAESLNPDEVKYITALKDAYYSLFVIDDIKKGDGLLLHDVFSEKKIFLADISFSSTAKIGNLLATRIVSLDNLHFTTGASCAFEGKYLDELKSNFVYLFEKKKNTMTQQQIMRKYNPYFFKMMKKMGTEIRTAYV
jgi:hypothetical protein